LREYREAWVRILIRKQESKHDQGKACDHLIILWPSFFKKKERNRAKISRFPPIIHAGVLSRPLAPGKFENFTFSIDILFF
jgi:hypothetical protein